MALGEAAPLLATVCPNGLQFSWFLLPRPGIGQTDKPGKTGGHGSLEPGPLGLVHLPVSAASSYMGGGKLSKPGRGTLQTGSSTSALSAGHWYTTEFSEPGGSCALSAAGCK